MFKKHKNKIKDIEDFPDHAFSGLRYFGYGLSIGVSKNGLRNLWCSFPYPLIHAEKNYTLHFSSIGSPLCWISIGVSCLSDLLT